MAKTFTYRKEEKLKSRKLMQELFSKGKSFTVFPLKVLYFIPSAKSDFKIKAGAGASSRNFKKAVDRNRIKRILRECYRTEKLPLHQFLSEHNKQVVIFLLYIDKVLPEYKLIKNKMPVVIQRLMKELNEKNTSNI